MNYTACSIKYTARRVYSLLYKVYIVEPQARAELDRYKASSGRQWAVRGSETGVVPSKQYSVRPARGKEFVCSVKAAVVST